MKTTKVLYGIALGLTLGLATTLKAQIYVGNSGTGTIGEYNLNGTTINASLISGVEYPTSIAISGTNLFVANSASGTIGEYTTSGATVKASLISFYESTDLALAISGANLFVMNAASGTICEYTTSGGTINAPLIAGLDSPACIAINPLPQLNIATAGNQVALFYPAWATNYILQSVTNLSSTNWLAVTNGVPVMTVTNGIPVITVKITNNLPTSFFRLVPAE